MGGEAEQSDFKQLILLMYLDIILTKQQLKSAVYQFTEIPPMPFTTSAPSPITIFGIGRNYADHARELGNAVPTEEPVVFLKAASSLRGINDGKTAYASEELHHEAELVIRVGKLIPCGTTNPGWDFIDAVTLGLDLTRREKQTELKSKGLPWTLAKSFLGASVLAPFVPRADLNGKTEFEFHFYVNETLKQRGDTRHMIFDVPFILDFLARSHSLLPGDLIYTGTPAGVGPMKHGDRFTLELLTVNKRWSGVL